MKNLLTLLILLHYHPCHTQIVQTLEMHTHKCWVLNSNLNLPAAKFHFVKDGQPDASGKEVKGHLELFSSFGIGLSFNYGEATIFRDIENDETLDEDTEFTNLIGFQIGVLYSSKIADDEGNNVNEFSVYGGVNILDVQVGLGYEYGARRSDTSRWFVSISYGIPIYKLTGKGSHIVSKRRA